MIILLSIFTFFAKKPKKSVFLLLFAKKNGLNSYFFAKKNDFFMNI